MLKKTEDVDDVQFLKFIYSIYIYIYIYNIILNVVLIYFR